MKNFESGFGFFRDYPWPQWLGEKNRKVEDFLDNAEKLYDKKTPWHFRAKNYMGEFTRIFKTGAINQKNFWKIHPNIWIGFPKIGPA